MKQKYAVYTPTEIGPEIVIHSRIGRVFVTLQAARKQAKACQGQVRAWPSMQVLEDHFQ